MIIQQGLEVDDDSLDVKGIHTVVVDEKLWGVAIRIFPFSWIVTSWLEQAFVEFTQ
jgi:hypothetical protein